MSTAKTKYARVGLVEGQDDAIFISKDIFEKNWQVLRTTVGGCRASVMFAFKTDGEAREAAKKIAEAIGGDFYGKTDPRKV